MAGSARQGRRVPRDDGVAATRLVLVLSAALAIAAGVAAMRTDYANRPLVAEVAGSDIAGQTHAQIAQETSCKTLRQWFQPPYNVWRGSVKRGREQVDQLDEMRTILARIGWLERHGRCGG